MMKGRSEVESRLYGARGDRNMACNLHDVSEVLGANRATANRRFSMRMRAVLLAAILVGLVGTALADDQPQDYTCVAVSQGKGGWEIVNNCAFVVEVAFTQPGGGLDDWFQMRPGAKQNKGLASEPYKKWICKDPRYPYDLKTHKVPRYGAVNVVCHGGNSGAAQ